MRTSLLTVLSVLLNAVISMNGYCVDVRVYTNHWYTATLLTGYSEYELELTVRGTDISSVTVQGPGVPSTSLKYEETLDTGEMRWTTTANLTGKPAVGDTYEFAVTYTSSTSETFYAAVSGTVEEFPKDISPVNGSTISTINPVFSWSALSTKLLDINIVVADPVTGKLMWYSEIPINAVSIVYNYDGKGDSLKLGGEYYWVIQFRDAPYDNSAMMMSKFTVLGSTGVAEDNDSLHPETMYLSQNIPNPFNPSTTIEYVIPGSKPEHVKLTIYDSRGALIKTLVNETRSSGRHSVIWNGTDNSGNRVSSGIYFYHIKAGVHSECRKMMAVR